MNEFESFKKYFNSLTNDEKIDFSNNVKIFMHQNGPFSKEPVDCVIWQRVETVSANNYNPNVVAPVEMDLLYKSILEDGYTQPVVTYPTDTHLEVVDGFHRSRICKERKDIYDRCLGYLPVVNILPSASEIDHRMASTIRHNRARGKHIVDNMAAIVLDLKKRNWSDKKIIENLGMDADEVLRLSQIGGLSEVFCDTEFSDAWEISDDISINEIIE